MKAVSAPGAGVVIACAMVLAVGLGGSACAAPTTPHDEAQAGGPAPPIPVVASTNVYGDVVEEIGADRVDVVSVISDPAQDPHSYEGSTRNQLALSKAEVVVENGGGYDDFVGRMLRSSDNSSADVVDAVDVSGKSPDREGELNEHVWYDLPTMGKVADEIAQALAEVAPADADAFRENAKDFKEKLAKLQARTERIESRHEGTSVAVTEPVPLYLTEASGLVNKTPADFSEAVEEGEEVSPQSLRETLALFSDKKVDALVHNEQTTGPQTEKVKEAAEDNGIPVVPVTETLPEGKDYIGWMSANITAIENTLDQ